MGGFEFAMVLKTAPQRMPSAAPVDLLVAGKALNQKGEILGGLLMAPRQPLAASPGCSIPGYAACRGRAAQPQRFRRGGVGAQIVPMNGVKKSLSATTMSLPRVIHAIVLKP